MKKRLSVLDNGIRVVTENLSHVDTVALGVWIDKGSRYETESENGMFHFIEHTLFKGTPDRNARQIAESVEGVGGLLDAYTAKEETCYSVRVRGKHLDFCLGILADMLIRPLFDRAELDRERSVIVEEIKMEEDNPEDLAYERNLRRYFEGHPLANPILGNPGNIRAFKRRQVREFHRRFYVGNNMVVAAAGRLDHHRLCDRLRTLFEGLPLREWEPPPQNPPQPRAFQAHLPGPHWEQVNFCLNFPGVSYRDPRRHAFHLLSLLLGGGMSSRLFQKIREERGLAYAIGTFAAPGTDYGLLSLYGGCSPRQYDRVLALCIEELNLLKRHGVTKEETSRAREQAIGMLVMGLEATQTRAAALARSLMTLNEIFEAEQEISGLEAVTDGQITELARELIADDALGLLAVGNFKDEVPSHFWSLNP